MKKLFTFFMAGLMIIFTSITNVAAADTNTTGSITIENAAKGETYKGYRIFDLEGSIDDVYFYKLSTNWKDFKDESSFTVDDAGYVTWIAESDDDTVHSFALRALSYAEDNSIPADFTSGEEYQKNYKFESLPFGDYLVNTTVVTLCKITDTNKDVVIGNKTEEPTIENRIYGCKPFSENVEYLSSIDAEIGEHITFSILINAKKGASNYVFKNTLSKGLTLYPLDNPGVAYNGKFLEEGVDYEYTEVTNPDKSTVFTIEFYQETLDRCVTSNNCEFKVIYQAIPTSDAVFGRTGNPNTAQLFYGDNQQTEESTVMTYLYTFNVFKYRTDSNGNPVGLGGAEFYLLNFNDYEGDIIDSTVLKLTPDPNNEGVYTFDPVNGNPTFTSPSDGKITINGLGVGFYYIREKKAPAGYNKLTEDVKVYIQNGGSTQNIAALDKSNFYAINIENKGGSVLPTTGGIGTTIFYVIGGILMVGALVLLIAKKKMTSISK